MEDAAEKVGFEDRTGWADLVVRDTNKFVVQLSSVPLALDLDKVEHHDTAILLQSAHEGD
jgi:hypothetical protein